MTSNLVERLNIQAFSQPRSGSRVQAQTVWLVPVEEAALKSGELRLAVLFSGGDNEVSLTITPRDRIILGVFVLVLIGAMWGYVRWATAPASGGRALQPTASRTLRRNSELPDLTRPKTASVTDIASTPLPAGSKSPATLPHPNYHFIAERNIFQPKIGSATTNKQTSPQPRTTKQSPRSLASPPPLPPAPPPPSSSTSVPPQVASQPNNLSATGITRIGDETYVLIENPQTRDTALVRVGESAFGYRIVSASENYVEVAQGDVVYRLVLGEGKQERKILASTSPSGPRPPFGGPFSVPLGGPFGQPGQQFGVRRGAMGSTNWVNRAIERWNQLPEFVRNRILQRIGEIWQQIPPDQQQQILQQFRETGINFNPPGR